MNANESPILAIETAIGGGSVSLSINGSEIEYRVGSGSISRAERLLPEIADILTTHNLRPADLGIVAASIGPGSFTGIRVGIATALGFKSAISAKCRGITSLQALALTSSSHNVLAAVSMGRNVVCYQQYRNNAAIDEPHLMGSEDFSNFANEYDGVLVHEGSLRDSLGESRSGIIDVGYNIAGLISAAVLAGYGSEDLTPLFVDRK